MQRLVLRAVLPLICSIIGSTICSAAYADTTISYETFDSWTNPEVAVNWQKSVNGKVSGGEFNQIYAAGQGISCGGDGSNFKSVYRDIAVTPGVFYMAQVLAMANCVNASGLGDNGNVRIWMQFDAANGSVLATHGATGARVIPQDTFNYLDVSATAPAGADHARVILQVLGGSGGGAVFTNFTLYKSEADLGLVTHAGPDFVRNTEWLHGSKIQQLWHAYSVGGGPGDYSIRPTSGSSQGISCAGIAGSYREISRIFDLSWSGLEGKTTKCEVGVGVVSNAINHLGIQDPSLVEVGLDFLDAGNHILPGGVATKGRDYAPYSQQINLNAQALTPLNATRVRIRLRLLAGIGGGAVFDEISLVANKPLPDS